MPRQIVEVETKTFIRFWLVILGFGLVGFLLISAAEALALIAVAALLAIAIRPLALNVNNLIGQKTKKSNLASVLAYLIVLLAIVAVLAVVGPVIISEFSKFVTNFPAMVENADLSGLNGLGKTFGIESLSTEIVRSIEDLSKNLLSSLGTGVVSGISTVSTLLGKAAVVLIMTLFFLLDGPGIVNTLWTKIGARESLKDAENVKDPEVKAVTEGRVIVTKMSHVVSTFVSHQVVIALADGCATAISVFIISMIFGVEARLAIPAGLITMTFYLIPMFGQVIGATLVTLILLFTSPLMAITWLAFYIVYGFIEVNIFAPKIQGNALKLRPIIILIAITIGTYMFGLFGAIIAIPIAGCIKVLVEELPNLRRIRS
ncbi:AI-2E family transporter [Candidatus Saccharibacteria bacterium]|nr:AI-2E family transporter [Candidatus Saccharibacteria bacterium]